MKFLDKLERKYGRYAIPHLMKYITILYALGFFLELFQPGFYTSYLSLDARMIVEELQIWRIFTFIIYSPTSNALVIFFSLYLYYMIGTLLERQWGAFRFNLYYFSGMVFHVLASLIVYFVFDQVLIMGTVYLNLSMFFAFAMFYGNMQFLLFFIIPIKLKWLAMMEGIYFGITIISGLFIDLMSPEMIQSLWKAGLLTSKAASVAALVSILNFLIFASSMKNGRSVGPREVYRRKVYVQKVEKAQKEQMSNGYRHKCTICGRTEKDDENLEFRYCSKCAGNHEYCQEHLFTHVHIEK